MELSSFFLCHVSKMTNKLKSNWCNSAGRTSQRDSHRIRGKFTTTTCNETRHKYFTWWNDAQISGLQIPGRLDFRTQVEIMYCIHRAWAQTGIVAQTHVCHIERRAYGASCHPLPSWSNQYFVKYRLADCFTSVHLGGYSHCLDACGWLGAQFSTHTVETEADRPEAGIRHSLRSHVHIVVNKNGWIQPKAMTNGYMQNQHL